VHFVTAELDGGPVIAQARVPIESGDDEVQLAQRLLPLEHRLLPAVLRLLVSQRLQWHDDVPHFDGQPLRRPLTLDRDGVLSTK
jgi:phosphoribosylglycinamide formyltransferase-1